MLFAVKARLYPTSDQKKYLAGLFGAVRFCFNKGLALKTHYYKVKGRSLEPVHDLKKLLPIAKKSKKYAWLKDYDSIALQESLRNLQKAFQRFFNRQGGFPHFKSRRGEQSSYHCMGVSVDQKSIKVPKMEPIKAVIHRKIDGKVKSITLSKDCCGDYWASVLYENDEAEVAPETTVHESQILGLDAGLKTFCTCSNGKKVKSPKPLKRAMKKLKKAQRALSRKKKGSKNREKARKRLAKLHRKVARIRADFNHKTSRRLVDENQALIFETLRIQNMMKNHHLAGAIADAGWGEFMRQCEYKAKREGKLFVKINTFFPSSKLCSHCLKKLPALGLSTRSWVCPYCGTHHDRDINAALNIKQEGIRNLKAAGLTVLRS